MDDDSKFCDKCGKPTGILKELKPSKLPLVKNPLFNLRIVLPVILGLILVGGGIVALLIFTSSPKSSPSPSSPSPSSPSPSSYTYSVGSNPRAIAIDSSGNVWVANDGSTVTELSSSGALIGTYTAGTWPWAIAIDSSGNVWVANFGNGTAGTASGDSNVMELNSSGALIGTYVAGSAPDAIAIDSSGNVWVANRYSNNVMELNSSSGKIIGTYPVGSSPHAIAIDSSGNVWVANRGTGIAGTASGDGNVTEFPGITTGPQYFPYLGPQYR